MVKAGTYVIIGLLCLAMAAGVFLGGPPPTRTAQGGGGQDGSPTAVPLSAAENARLERERATVATLLKQAGGDSTTMGSVDGKIAALQQILDHGDLGPAASAKRRALGVVFGDILAEREGMKWVTVERGSQRKIVLLLEERGMVLTPTRVFVPGPDGTAPADVKLLLSGAKEQLRAKGSR